MAVRAETPQFQKSQKVEISLFQPLKKQFRSTRGGDNISNAITEKWKDPLYRQTNSGKPRNLVTMARISLGISRRLRKDPEMRAMLLQSLKRINESRYGNGAKKQVEVKPLKTVPEKRRRNTDKARDTRYADRRIWLAAKKTGIIDQILELNLMSIGEISLLYGYFEKHRGSFPDKAIEKLSIAVANLA